VLLLLAAGAVALDVVAALAREPDPAPHLAEGVDDGEHRPGRLVGGRRVDHRVEHDDVVGTVLGHVLADQVDLLLDRGVVDAGRVADPLVELDVERLEAAVA
jgi:hypothetical protein